MSPAPLAAQTAAALTQLWPRDQVLTGLKALRYSLSDLHIRTKQRELLPLAPNPVQQRYLDTLLPGWRDRPFGLRGVRDQVLKARQHGISTLVLALFFLDTINTPHTYTVVLADTADNTRRLFQIIKRYYDSLPAHRRPRTKYNSVTELFFPDLDSTIYVGTAGAKSFGRGSTVNNVLASEAAFWPDAENVLAGLLQAVPASGNVIVESTANGANWFHDAYWSSHRDGQPYRTIFLPWSLNSDYRIHPAPGFVPDGQEMLLMQAHGLDLAQIAWRRRKKRELGRLFAQEYPLTADEAFLSSADRVLSSLVFEPAPVGHLVPDFIPPRTWKHYCIIDPGLRRFAALFAAVDPDGRAWLWAEHYESRWKPEQHMQFLHGLWEYGGSPEIRVLMDPAGFDKMRTTSGHEHDSYADEMRTAAGKIGAKWFKPAPADNRDPGALRGDRWLATRQMFICSGLESFLWEARRWTLRREQTGRAAEEQRDSDRPRNRDDHLMDCYRYLCNALPEPREEVDVDELTGMDAVAATHWKRSGQRSHRG